MGLTSDDPQLLTYQLIVSKGRTGYRVTRSSRPWRTGAQLRGSGSLIHRRAAGTDTAPGSEEGPAASRSHRMGASTSAFTWTAMAVAEGFEPSDGGYPSHAFEACS